MLEGVIIDKRFLDSVKRKYLDVKGPFRRYAIAADDFPNFAVDWNGLDTYIQNKAIVQDYGIYPDPDTFFKEHCQSPGAIRSFLYKHIGCRKMRGNIERVRNRG